MSDHLFKPPKPVAMLRPLTDRQQRVYGLICSRTDGVTSDELGAMLHAGQLRHAADERCEWCGRDGARALRERAVRQRVVRRAGGVYEPRVEADRPVRDSPQVRELPGESFEDIFGSEAA